MKIQIESFLFWGNLGKRCLKIKEKVRAFKPGRHYVSFCLTSNALQDQREIFIFPAENADFRRYYQTLFFKAID